MELKAVLTIAGSDSIGGAGIQADIKTMLANGVYAMSAVTALTAQNTQGVAAIMDASPEFLAAEIDAVFDDIRPAAVKIGMVSAAALIKVIAGRLRAHKAENIVVDPVMVATSGARLLDEDASDSLTAELFPFAALITPNLPELELLTGDSITSREERIDAARKLAAKWGCAVLSKGGHTEKSADDILVTDSETTVFPGTRIDTKNTHGTGCTLSSAIAANLAKGASLTAAIRQAKDYVAGALAADLKMGKGHGPLHHGFDLKSRFLAPFSPVEGK
ncbi:MAG: bifunctional hydroxymethylpyrimidine kinase/phosphomethylpyrimidine kinase [Negativicutes bacterium]